MSTPRAGQPGATRLCPHCKATVLESASICPGCRHHLRFSGGKQLAEEFYTALSVDGTIAHRQALEPCEYCIVLDIANERGEQVMRQVVGVGALQPGELRRLKLSVQMLPLISQVQPHPQPAAAAAVAARPSLGSPAGVAAAASASAASATGSQSRTSPPSSSTPGSGRPAAAPAAAGTAAALTTPTAAPRPGGTVTGTGAPTAAGTPKAPAAPQPPGAAPSQRLRIFRKP